MKVTFNLLYYLITSFNVYNTFLYRKLRLNPSTHSFERCVQWFGWLSSVLLFFRRHSSFSGSQKIHTIFSVKEEIESSLIAGASHPSVSGRRSDVSPNFNTEICIQQKIGLLSYFIYSSDVILNEK